MKVHVVDGTFELFRCHRATPARTDSDGHEVGAAAGLLSTLTALLRDVTHVAIAFDTIVDARLPAEGTPWDQHALAAEVARSLGMVVWPMIRRFEADDALATAAARFAPDPRVEQVVLCTRDKDLAQCVRGRRVVQLDRVTDTVIDEEAVVAKWGVAPPLIPSLLALVGDAADGLPGIPGIGRVTAAALLQAFGSLEAIPDEVTGWPARVPAVVGAVWRERRREAVLYRDQIELATNVPLREEVADLEWPGADRRRLEPLAHRLGVPEVLDRVPRWTELSVRPR